MNEIIALRNRFAQLNKEEADILKQLIAIQEAKVNELRKELEDSKQDMSYQGNVEATENDDTLESAKKDLEQTYQKSEPTDIPPQSVRDKYIADIENNRTYIHNPHCALSKLGQYLVNNYKGEDEEVFKLFNDVSFMAYYTPILDKVDTPELIAKLIDNWLGRSTVDLVSELETVEQNQNLGKEKNKFRALIWYGLLQDKDEEVKDLISNKQFLDSFSIHHKTSPYSDTSINTIKDAIKASSKSNTATPSS